MTTTTILILALMGVFVAYVALAPIVTNIGRFYAATWLFCPQHQEYALVNVRPLQAALTVAYGEPSILVRKCTRLPPGERCEQGCLAEADL